MLCGDKGLNEKHCAFSAHPETAPLRQSQRVHPQRDDTEYLGRHNKSQNKKEFTKPCATTTRKGSIKHTHTYRARRYGAKTNRPKHTAFSITSAHVQDAAISESCSLACRNISDVEAAHLDHPNPRPRPPSPDSSLVPSLVDFTAPSETRSSRTATPFFSERPPTLVSAEVVVTFTESVPLGEAVGCVTSPLPPLPPLPSSSSDRRREVDDESILSLPVAFSRTALRLATLDKASSRNRRGRGEIFTKVREETNCCSCRWSLVGEAAIPRWNAQHMVNACSEHTEGNRRTLRMPGMSGGDSTTHKLRLGAGGKSLPPFLYGTKNWQLWCQCRDENAKKGYSLSIHKFVRGRSRASHRHAHRRARRGRPSELHTLALGSPSAGAQYCA